MIAEKEGKNIIANFSRRALSLRSGLIYGLLTLLLAVALTGGMTSAWFTSGDQTENTFTAGTLDLEVNNLNEIQTGSWEIGDCLENQYTITNSGSKKMYVRASFDGFWKRLYHRNTATATVLYNGQTITDSDQAHYDFAGYGPSYSSNFTPEASQGFFDESSPVPSLFPYLWSASKAISTNSDLSTLNTVNAAVLTGYPDNCTGPLVSPVTGQELSIQFSDLFPDNNYKRDPIPDKVRQYLGPPESENCSVLHSFKINLNQKDIVDGKTYKLGDNQVSSSDPNSQFEVTIYKSDNNINFAFSSNFPVHHVYAKGGDLGGNFYLYSEGIYQDCGLSQPGGGWSHITFYYCVPTAKPSLKLVKQVSVNGGEEEGDWIDADEAFGPSLIDQQPKFRFWVTNNGNVTLENIVITDDVFGYIGKISSLAPGVSDGFIIADNYWKTVLDSGNVTITLCGGMNNWEKMGNYYYYKYPIEKGQSVTLCVKVCLTGPTGPLYDGAEFTLYSYFEAVQTTNGLVHQNWNPNPYPKD